MRTKKSPSGEPASLKPDQKSARGQRRTAAKAKNTAASSASKPEEAVGTAQLRETAKAAEAVPAPETAQAAGAAQAADEVFEQRLARHYDELKWLYCEL